MMEERQLPTGWRQVYLSEIADIGAGNPAPQGKEKFIQDGLPFVRVQDMGRLSGRKFLSSTSDRVNEHGASGLRLFKKGTVLLTKSGASTLLNQRAVLGLDSYVVSHIATVVAGGATTADWLYYFLRTVDAATLAHGGNMPSLPLSRIKQIHTPLAPIAEQRRILEKIETLFAELDKGVEALREVQTLLGRYRQSVLKAAVTGHLTADWRAENADRLEHGRDLLACVRQTRRETWEGRGKYKEPAAPDTSDLPELPEGWIWASFDQLFHIFGGATPSRRVAANWHGDIPWVSSGEVAFCRIKDTSEKISITGYGSCSTKLHPEGTVLLAMIGEGKTRGQAAILDIAACNNQNAAAIRVSQSGIPPEYVYYFLMSHYEQSRNKGQGGNQPALNGEKVKGFLLPLPSLDEIWEIVIRIDKAFACSTAVEKWCESELARSAALRQSILKDAFSGRLVPQDPADEPAAALLARIQKSRATASRKTRGKVTA